MKALFTLFFIGMYCLNASAQNVGINTTGAAPNNSALLDVAANNKGVLIPQVILTSSTDAVTIATPANSLLVYNTSISTSNGLKGAGYYYNSGTPVAPVWVKLINTASGYTDTTQAWRTTGNIGTDTAINFLGTIDSMPLRFKLNNTWAGQWDAKNGNYFIGKNAGSNTIQTLSFDGRNNIGIGDSALYSNTTGYYNIALGKKSLHSNTIGNNNIANGRFSLINNTTGSYNIAIGASALFENNIGWGNIAFGQQALYKNTSGSYNIAIGDASLHNNTTGSYNIANGFFALCFNSTADNNIANGYNALFNNTTGENNIANGYKTLLHNSTGENNIANGYHALYNNRTANNNIANGYEALRTNTVGHDNIANGYFTLYNNEDGNYNIANGYQALYANTSGEYNIASGWIALASNQTGNNNVALGRRALEVNVSGNNNIGIGARTLEASTTDNNTGIGAFALQTPNTGANNTGLGYGSDVSLVSATNATALGYNATAPASNYVRVGNTLVTSIFGAVAFNTSDGRFKTNIKNNVPGLDFILKLRPVTYHFEKAKYSQHIGEKQDADYVKELQTQDAENKTSSGFIAQEVEQAAKELNYDFDGLYKPQNDKDTYGIGYQQFVVPLVKAVQEQQQMILDLQKQLKQQQLLLEQLQKK